MQFELVIMEKIKQFSTKAR